MANFLKDNQDAFTGAGVAIVLGFISKMALKKEVIPISNGVQIFSSFVVVSLAGIGANELRKKYEL